MEPPMVKDKEFTVDDENEEVRGEKDTQKQYLIV